MLFLQMGNFTWIRGVNIQYCVGQNVKLEQIQKVLPPYITMNLFHLDPLYTEEAKIA